LEREGPTHNGSPTAIVYRDFSSFRNRCKDRIIEVKVIDNRNDQAIRRKSWDKRTGRKSARVKRQKTSKKKNEYVVRRK